MRRSATSSACRSGADNFFSGFVSTVRQVDRRAKACLIVGLDPGLGILHVDYARRDSFALDLMEGIRPSVDAYVLNLVRSRRFHIAIRRDPPWGLPRPCATCSWAR
jgi:hypothetical protein